MTILHPRLFLAICAGAGLIAFTPEARRPPAELAAIDESAIGFSAAPVDAPPPSQAADAGREARLPLAARPSAANERIDDAGSLAGAPPSAIHPPPPEAASSDADLAAQFADADLQAPAPPRAVPMSPACCVRAEPAAKPSPPGEEAPPSGAALLAQFAYADVPSAGPVISALSEVAPSLPAAAPAPDSPSPPPPLGSEAAILYNRGDVAGLAALAQAANDAAGRSALEWASLRANPHPSFASLAAFLEAHPTWPSRGWIREREEAELAAHPEAPAKVAEFFAGGQPQTSAGKIAAARAAKATGRSGEAAQIIRALWRDGNFDALTEGVILRDFGPSLQKDDHKYRADRLLYAGYVGAASRAAALAGPDVLALAEARIEAARAPMSAALLKAVPAALRDDPGLLFSRVQYARRAGRVYEAAVLLSLAPHDRAAVVSPDRWWSERKMIAAALLDLDEPRLAFEVCDETVRPETSEAEVDADFHAGWIALRFLNDPPLAAERFALAAEAADAPLSIARAAYWQGRAAESMGGSEAARGFYERAASEPIAYYGQLAAQRLGQTRLALRAPKQAAEGDRRDEAVGAVAALYGDGLDDLAASLAFDAAKQWRDESQIAAMAEVVQRFGDAGTQVQFGKFALVRGYPLDATAFPASGMPAFLPLAHSADLPTVYAVARQESEFIWRSSSWAGAKGLMQMLPSTAVLTARQAGVEFDYARLIADPGFNTRLGASLLGQLIADEGGSRELAFAAYNAGPGRVTQWIAAHGDPRDGTADLIDWIERIPFDETRDYVQRVSENLGVYRQRFADERPAPPRVSARLARE
jgi:soluble lytic murein transglycosylase